MTCSRMLRVDPKCFPQLRGYFVSPVRAIKHHNQTCDMAAKRNGCHLTSEAARPRGREAALLDDLASSGSGYMG